ncbi:MAG: flagellar basal body protein [Candidatus Dactylopiibacterium carminicum]|uniref:Flagellar protein FliL n=1 Tax=Candidatus Dactylopiibacterium carminicum TaxID=857335 RepID=A0A272EWH5_9RHOO|nr:flagellar basal body-associated FliL family protein [Candidatus Dactylopiibacterium carminicum]KAF7599964.1 flagellar basal body protein [Candidatus Dactylopiibacterium carminicum]PAS94455.1 MAG: flagellar basal body protein [Candidatus Dactylopiibacterium carminicum]PAS97060.1 MAG: flagellar basal body protein [Candidatus Dactylopiibacterium carminicum]PAS99967.1 MAG: hypothetical protein BSR46_05115 [Candidatus Dactylopiibacterium carminicum]
MNKLKLILLFLIAGVLLAGAGAGGAWWLLRARAPAVAGETPAPAVEKDKRNYKYVSLDKVIVMLRSDSGAPMSHYLAMDLVFKAEEKAEKHTKEHLPLLRSIAVKALSAYTLEEALNKSIDDLTVDVNRAFTEGYARDNAEQPFVEALISKLIIE